MQYSKTLFLVVGLMGVSLAFGQKKQPDPVYVDPAKAGEDYAIQGEYRGQLTLGSRAVTVGAQIIALGNGKFRFVGYIGGLPGDKGFNSDKARRKIIEASKDGKKVHFKDPKEGLQVKLEGDTATVIAPSGMEVGALKKVERKSSTLGAKPPKGAIVLFDGSTAEHFVRGKIVMKNLLQSDCESKAKFGDHRLHLEFRTPFKPLARGQARGNSGVYIQSRYEVQVLDSFGLDGLNNECGGIYKIAAPKVNMCYPPLTWQTYDIDFKAARYEGAKKVENARVTIRHNGVVIHDDLELPNHTPGKSAEGANKLGLYLQGHGNPVRYRNIWVAEIKN